MHRPGHLTAAGTSPGTGMFGGSLGAGALALGDSAPDGLGVTVRAVSGPGAAWRVARNVSPALNAIGQTAEAVTDARQAGTTAGLVVAGVLLGLAIRGGAGYLVGKAMAPRAFPDAQRRYAWTGAALAVFFGTLGLGGQALYALRRY